MSPELYGKPVPPTRRITYQDNSNLQPSRSKISKPSKPQKSKKPNFRDSRSFDEKFSDNLNVLTDKYNLCILKSVEILKQNNLNSPNADTVMDIASTLFINTLMRSGSIQIPKSVLKSDVE